MTVDQTKTLVFVKVRMSVSPIHQEFRGYRIVVAHPNLCGRPGKNGDLRPSWEKPYFILATGDLPRITPELFHRFMAQLQRRGYRSYKLWSELEPQPWFNNVKGVPR